MLTELVAFVPVAALVICTPGPDTALTVRNTLLGGARGGVFTAMGVAAGQVLWASAASAGVVGLLVASAPVFEALKLVGAAYLMVIGVQTIYGSFFLSMLGMTRPGQLRQN